MASGCSARHSDTTFVDLMLIAATVDQLRISTTGTRLILSLPRDQVGHENHGPQ